MDSAIVAAQVDIQTADWWFKVAFSQGIALAFLVAFLGCMLWVTVICIKMLQKWIPLKFQASIDRDISMTKNLDKCTEMLTCVHDRTHDMAYATRHLALAAKKMAAHNKERLGISSDVMIHFDEATGALRNVRQAHQTAEEGHS
jgi:hypothetical protein